MKGAIIGDIVGSAYERHHSKMNDFTQFKLFKNRCRFTDDTVLTAAVADSLLLSRNLGIHDDAQILKMLTQKMQTYFRRYSDRGGSKSFTAWANSDDPTPYNGYTNGALMRCAPAGWLAGSVEEARHLGELTALPSHNHPEAVTAASMLAELIFRARAGASKDELLAVIRTEYEIPCVEEIRPTYRYDISCKGTLPVCFAAFYESKDFENALRISVSLGGDTDTNGAITCSLAEAFYGIPDALWADAVPYCDENILSVVSAFYDMV